VNAALTKRIWSAWKLLRARLKFNGSGRRVLLIFGCQRSGTTLVTRLFDRDPDARVFGEFSKLSSQNGRKGLRLRPIEEIKAELDQQPFPLIVLKPLVESQNALDLLGAIDGSRGLWLYRHYADVAFSDLEKFGARNGIDNIRPIAERQNGNWRSENVSKEVADWLRFRFAEDMNVNDAAVLFWFARNHLFFDQHLDRDPRVLPVPYDDLVAEPDAVMRLVYNFLQHRYPGIRIVDEVRTSSIGRGRTIRISSDVQRECDLLLASLDRSYEAARAVLT